MEPIERRASAVWRGDLASGVGHLRSESGVLDDEALTFARRTGEPEGHTNPEELIAAAHAGCYAMSLAAALARAGASTKQLDVTAAVALERDADGLKLTSSTLTIAADVADLDPGALAEIVADADRRCPISNALRDHLAIEHRLEAGRTA